MYHESLGSSKGEAVDGQQGSNGARLSRGPDNNKEGNPSQICWTTRVGGRRETSDWK